MWSPILRYVALSVVPPEYIINCKYFFVLNMNKKPERLGIISYPTKKVCKILFVALLNNEHTAIIGKIRFVWDTPHEGFCTSMWYSSILYCQVLPVNPTLVATTPEAQPNWASGNQNQDIPNHAFSVFMATSENKHFIYVWCVGNTALTTLYWYYGLGSILCLAES